MFKIVLFILLPYFLRILHILDLFVLFLLRSFFITYFNLMFHF